MIAAWNWLSALLALVVAIGLPVCFGWQVIQNRKKRLVEWKQRVLTHHRDEPDVEPFMVGGCPQCGKRPE